MDEAINHPQLEQVDAIEVFNGMASPREAVFTKEVANRLHLPGTGGSDAHQPHRAGCCLTAFTRPLLNNEEELVAEFKRGLYKAVHRQFDLEYACCEKVRS